MAQCAPMGACSCQTKQQLRGGSRKEHFKLYSYRGVWPLDEVEDITERTSVTEAMTLKAAFRTS